MIKVGITGQSGFIGTHLASAIANAADMELIPFKDSFFSDVTALREFVGKCDAIMHLAAMSRAASEMELYKTNRGLVQLLIDAMEVENVAPHVLFASSTHEIRDTAYGRAKREGRELLGQWAEKVGAGFTGFIFPNVYGPGARVFYASFIANFAWQLNHHQEPTIQVDATIRLIFVENLVKLIMARIRAVAKHEVASGFRMMKYEVPHDFERKVSEILALFRSFQLQQPSLADENIQNLYKTFLSYR